MDAPVIVAAMIQDSRTARSTSATTNSNSALLKESAAIVNSRCSTLRSESVIKPIATSNVRVRGILYKVSRWNSGSFTAAISLSRTNSAGHLRCLRTCSPDDTGQRRRAARRAWRKALYAAELGVQQGSVEPIGRVKATRQRGIKATKGQDTGPVTRQKSDPFPPIGARLRI